jgi:hypothetical protein
MARIATWRPPWHGGVMKALLHFRTHNERYFHSHPLQGTFSLITTLVTAMLIVLLLVMSAK